MATLAGLIKGFRYNVREGCPCELRYDGSTIQLVPLPLKAPKTVSEQENTYYKTCVGIVLKPSYK